MVRNLSCFIIILCCCCGVIHSQNSVVFKAAFWNVENLFDTINNPKVMDDDFTPEGYKQWSKSRLNRKVDKLAKVIVAMGEWDNVALLGLCEVENDTVIRKLIYHTPLKHLDYRYIHRESNDVRGIDVALVYQSSVFSPISSKLIDLGDNMRGILYVKGVIGDDTLHVFVNHWSSRRGGLYKTEGNRVRSAEILKFKTDSLQRVDVGSNILIMGDFNDDPDDKSLCVMLDAQPYTNNSTSSLVNLTYKYLYKDLGTIKFRGKWNVFDNIIVSKSLINGVSKLKVCPESCSVFYIEDMIKNGKNGFRPNPTYLGPYYNSGVSDHLPVIVDFIYNAKY